MINQEYFFLKEELANKAILYQLHLFSKGYSGVDIGPLKDGKLCLVGLVPDSQRYFDYHHSKEDIFEMEMQIEIEIVSISMSISIVFCNRQRCITIATWA